MPSSWASLATAHMRASATTTRNSFGRKRNSGRIVIRSKQCRITVKVSSAIAHMATMPYICGMEDLKYIDDDWVAELIEEARLYDGIEVDTSWYKGPGWYDWSLRKKK